MRIPFICLLSASFALSCGSDEPSSTQTIDRFETGIRITDREVDLGMPEQADEPTSETQEQEGTVDQSEPETPPNFCLGYAGSNTCCQNHDPCDWANNYQCDCDNTCGWDGSDCSGATDLVCSGYDGWDLDCCRENDPCYFANDGWCDCDGACSWEDEDCSGGGSGEVCPGYTGWSDCCYLDDPCEYADDTFCDCSGTCPWDAADCR